MEAPGTQQALQAWLAAISPGSSCAPLPTPAVQGLLRQLRMSTPALGPQVSRPQSKPAVPCPACACGLCFQAKGNPSFCYCGFNAAYARLVLLLKYMDAPELSVSIVTGWCDGALQGIASTPFLAGLARTLPVLTPGISPGELQAVLQGGAARDAQQPTDSQAAAHTAAPAVQQPLQQEDNAAADGATQAEVEAAHSSTDMEAGCASSLGAQAGEDAWAGLVDLTPAAKGSSGWPDGSPFMHQAQTPAAGDADRADEQGWLEQDPDQAAQGPQLPSASWEALMQGGSASPDAAPASVVRPTPGAAKSTHKKRVSWGSTTEQVQLVPQQPADGLPAPDQAATPVLGPAESVGSTSPATGSYSSPTTQVYC